ncbi:dna polymerase zeta subunit [Diplodia corticola]|uniref:DNA polymerase n=1 Tax=Diplodia corticola TaxID=236234 RepID=A0A1J9RAH4_9PEZI|nr:dna polymerase zeta subunit [Diplodia corticola]OJD37544.1 dna polymerase zeta subunit [Diplodia corticola]
MDGFRFRLNCVDHYQAAPTEFDPKLHRELGLPSQRHDAYQVPVIRAFGATETGQKVCAHIHGALPYLYLEYDGSLEQDAVDAYIQSLRISIDHALAVSYRRNAYDGKTNFVAHITLVKGVPFFGYHVGYRFFLKVYMLNPSNMTRLADLLQQGTVLAKVLQPYESHLQYLLQWMCDYNLYGCAYIDCAKVKFRDPVPDSLEMRNPAHRWHDRSISPEWISDADSMPRQSHCSVEVDICVHDILNRKEIHSRPIHHDFQERFNHLAPDEKYVHSMAGLWRDETIRRKRRMGLTDPGSSPFPPEVLVTMSADPRDTGDGGWIHEEEYREILEKLIDDERKVDHGSDVGFDHFVKPTARESEIKTVLESVEDLFPESLEIFHATQKPAFHHHQADGAPPPLVDEESATQVNDEDAMYDFDDEIAQETALHQTAAERNVVGVKEGREPNEKDTDKYEARPDGNDHGERFQDPEDPIEPMFGDEDSGTFDSENEYGSFHEDFLESSLNQSGQKHGIVSIAAGLGKRQKLYNFTERSNEASSSPMRLSPNKPTLSSKRVAFNDKVDDLAEPTNNPWKNPSQDMPASQSSQGSIKAQQSHGPNTLSFPVVKSPHDPEAALRLSKRAGWSNSQKSPHTPSKSSWPNEGKHSINTSWSDAKTGATAASSNAPVSPQVLQMAEQLRTGSFVNSGATVLCFAQLPPTAEAVSSTMLEYGLPPVIYQNAHYSDERDVPDRPREYAGREFKLESTTVPYLPLFDPTGTSPTNFGQKPSIVIDKAKEDFRHRRRSMKCSLLNWELATVPPTYAEVEKWLKEEENERAAPDPGEVDVDLVAEEQKRLRAKAHISQIEGPTQRNRHGFKYSQKQESTSVNHETQYMSIMSLEVHVNSRGTLLPDPAKDEIACIFWCVQTDDESEGVHLGVTALSNKDGIAKSMARILGLEVQYEEDELDLLNKVVDIVREFDPDILTGYEVHNSSWGYVIERARLKYEYNLCDEFSRMKSQSHGRFGKEADRWGFTHTSTIQVTGRHMINIWRAMRGELNLLQYTMENVVFHLLHKRIPHFTHQDLTKWYQGGKPRDLAKVLDHFLSRVQLNIDILEANEIIARTSEQARLLGVDFFSVISRGSQFKVESLMFRIAKPENFLLPSPSRRQVGQQNALECLPLVMEPQSAFYNSPVLVLDFQSLYPSVMIAYNYCYSTFLGRIVGWRGQNKMGFTDFQREPRLLELVKDYVNIAPNGIMYVRPEMRKSLLAKMLGEILETRVMVKSGMKVDKDDRALQQLLNNRQLALKLIANVTYGYTSASFSGRMPCSEIADSIVQTGRETLEKAVAFIHSVAEWGAEVVYGDTDSLFVHLPGRTREDAFDIGEKIAAAVTERNPRPVKLKFEKVYHPCVLLAKKRYVGFKYESRQQQEPEFDAKGIETVRRDGTPAEQKIEEKALKLLFRTQDLSQVKRYFQAQCRKIMDGRVSIQDFLFAREVKLGTYADKGPGPPGALIATKRMLADHRAEPQYGERLPYVVVTGAPGARLVDRCVDPARLLADDQLELDAEYYISKNLIPPLERIFNLVGANVRAWYDEMPKVQRVRNVATAAATGDAALAGGGGGVVIKKTLENYMRSGSCFICRTKLDQHHHHHRPPSRRQQQQQQRQPAKPTHPHPLPLCPACLSRPHAALLDLRARQQRAERRARDVDAVCRGCEGGVAAFGDEVRCASRDCPVFYSRVRARAGVRAARGEVEEVAAALERREEARDGGGGGGGGGGEGLDW